MRQELKPPDWSYWYNIFSKALEEPRHTRTEALREWGRIRTTTDATHTFTPEAAAQSAWNDLRTWWIFLFPGLGFPTTPKEWKALAKAAKFNDRPHKNGYNSCWKFITSQAIFQGQDPENILDSWERAFEEAPEDQYGDIMKYEMEARCWDILFPDNHEFPGKDPREQVGLLKTEVPAPQPPEIAASPDLSTEKPTKAPIAGISNPSSEGIDVVGSPNLASMGASPNIPKARQPAKEILEENFLLDTLITQLNKYLPLSKKITVFQGKDERIEGMEEGVNQVSNLELVIILGHETQIESTAYSSTIGTNQQPNRVDQVVKMAKLEDIEVEKRSSHALERGHKISSSIPRSQKRKSDFVETDLARNTRTRLPSPIADRSPSRGLVDDKTRRSGSQEHDRKNEDDTGGTGGPARGVATRGREALARGRNSGSGQIWRSQLVRGRGRGRGRGHGHGQISG